jgi:hypothetical protein
VVTLLAADNVPESRRDEAADTLETAGVQTETRVSTAGPFDALVDAMPGHDAVVMGEAAPSLSSVLFGEESNRAAAAFVGPVLAVRRDQPETDTVHS